MTSGGLMTIGELSRRTGTPVKALRAWTDMGMAPLLVSRPVLPTSRLEVRTCLC